ncbi:MAG: DUF1192 domain-containing protein [Proteobacteria bacterium]|nr:DUF1192 domain-containing protein [Pseudomonadota bacterium]
MDDDDLALQHVAVEFRPRSLAALSIKALGDYIIELEAEIIRVRATVAEKESARGEADSVFR